MDAEKSLAEFSDYEFKSYGLRTYNLKNFPYRLYFSLLKDQNLIEIVAILHGHAEFSVSRLT